MKSWKDNNNGTVTLAYAEGEIVVSKKDFNRAFGAMINMSFADAKELYAI